MKKEKIPELLTLKEAAEILKCSRETARRLCLKGKIQSTRLAGGWRVSKDDLEKKILKTLNEPKIGELVN